MKKTFNHAIALLLAVLMAVNPICGAWGAEKGREKNLPSPEALSADLELIAKEACESDPGPVSPGKDYDESYVSIEAPVTGEVIWQGEDIYFAAYLFNPWEDYYAKPYIIIKPESAEDYNGVYYATGTVADNGYYNYYEAYLTLDTTTCDPGKYTLKVLAAPCDSEGKLLDNFLNMDPLYAERTFSIVENPNKPHVHTVVTDPGVEPTCTKTGLTSYSYCSECGAVLEERYTLPSLGHDMVVTSIKLTDCEKGGEEISRCSRCDETSVRTIPASSHIWSNAFVIASEPTCTKDGEKLYACENCQVTRSEAIPATNHEKTTIILKGVEPTCTEPGLTNGSYCTECGETIVAQTEIPMLDHDLVLKSTDVTNCEEGGSSLYACTRCDYTERKEIAPGTHSYTVIEEQKSTLEEQGFKLYKCEVCGNTYTERLPYTSISAPKLTLSYTDAKGVQVKWESVPEKVTKYQIYRSKSADSGFSRIASLAADKTSYKDKKAIPGTTYYYKVRACYDENLGQWSKVKSVTVKKLPTPEVTLTGLEKGVKVSYKKITRAEGYEIYYSKNSDSGFKKMASTDKLSSSKKDGFSMGKTYYFKVRAYQTIKDKKYYSNYSKVKSLQISSMTQPVLNTRSKVWSNKIQIKWKKVSGASGYYVYRKTPSGSFKRVANIKNGKTYTYTDTDVSGEYQYKIKAYKSGETSAPSNIIHAHTLGKLTLTIDPADSGWVFKASWKKVSNATSYKVLFGKEKGFADNHETTITTKRSLLFDVKHCVYYTWEVYPLWESGDCVSEGQQMGTDTYRLYCEPNVTGWMSKNANSDCSYMHVIIENNGKHPLTIYRLARYTDKDYPSYSRTLDLIDRSDWSIVDKIKIPAGESETVTFQVRDYSTYYDPACMLGFYFSYQGHRYMMHVSGKYGSLWTEADD